jgi:hypothetical protein
MSVNLEQQTLSKLIDQGRTAILIEGPPQVGVVRALEVILEREEGLILDSRKQILLQEGHPDLTILDGRELKIDDLRTVCRGFSRLPALWSKSYVILPYLDLSYYLTSSVLLKVIEECPGHVCFFIAVRDRNRIPPTIASRTLTFSVRGFDSIEMFWWLEFQGKSDHLDLRLRGSGGDPDLAESLEIPFFEEWALCWDSFVLGLGELPGNFLAIWLGRFEAMSETTQLTYWYLVGECLIEKFPDHPLWLEMGVLASQARSALMRGSVNQNQTSVFLIKLYALARTLKNRLRRA